MAKLTQDDRAVMQCIYDLQLVGRRRPNSDGQDAPFSTPVTYDPVPRLAIVGEFYGHDQTWDRDGVYRLDRILRRLEAIGEVSHTIGSNAETHEHVRPDGKVLQLKTDGHFYVAAIDGESVYAQNLYLPNRLRDRVNLSDREYGHRFRVDQYDVTDRGIATVECNGSDEGPSPRWDAERRSLSYKGRLVKRFRAPAENQEIVLASFQELGWPGRIDDPIPGRTGMNSRRRLSDTVKRLNPKKGNLPIRFDMDGTGQGVIWEVVQP